MASLFIYKYLYMSWSIFNGTCVYNTHTHTHIYEYIFAYLLWYWINMPWFLAYRGALKHSNSHWVGAPVSLSNLFYTFIGFVFVFVFCTHSTYLMCILLIYYYFYIIAVALFCKKQTKYKIFSYNLPLWVQNRTYNIYTYVYIICIVYIYLLVCALVSGAHAYLLYCKLYFCFIVLCGNMRWLLYTYIYIFICIFIAAAPAESKREASYLSKGAFLH